MNLGTHLAAAVALLLAGRAVPLPTAPASTTAPPAGNASMVPIRRAVVFEPNVGQFEPGVRYRATVAGRSLSLTDTAAHLSLGAEPGAGREIRVTLAGASGHARPVALDRLTGVVNHFEGATAAAWRAGVPTFGRVRYAGVYPGIDLVYHGSPEQLEYDFIVGRGADPSRIAVRFDGADRVEVDPAGDLLIHAGETVVRQRPPYAWQQHGHERRRVDARYRVTEDGAVAFAIGSYDRRLPLVIDPILVYASYLHAYSSRVAVDAAGCVTVVTERTLTGSYSTTGIKVERLTPDGQTAIYTTLIGSDSFDVAGVTATLQGEAIVAGSTYSPNLPLVNASQVHPGDTFSNAFILKLDPGGAFVFSTYLGGTSFDNARSVSVNRAGTIAVAGETSSQDFPGIDGLQSGPAQGFVTLFSPAGSRLHGALLPASLTAVVVDDVGAVYVAANTLRKDWPTTPQSFQPTPSQVLCIDDSVGPCRQGVLARISGDLRSLVYSTYLHPTNPEAATVDISVQALAVDAAGAAYILGYGYGPSFPATPGVLQEQCPDWCGFLAKLNPTGSALVYSTFVPGFPNALQVDARGNTYLAGSTSGIMTGFTPTANAQQPRSADAQLFVTADGGTTWHPKPPAQQADSVAVAHSTGPLLYTASYHGGLFRSTDLGDHWLPIDAQPSWSLFVAQSNPNVMYEPLDGLIRRSSDGGATWALVPAPIGVRSFAVDPVDAQTLYIGGDGLFKSVNGGYAWSPAASGIPTPSAIESLVAAPSNRSVLFASVYRPWPIGETETYRTVNGGASWTRVILPTEFPRLISVVFDPLDAMRVYGLAIGSTGRVLRSTDGGVTWGVFIDCWCSPLAVTHAPDPTVFVSSYGTGLARVIDTGVTVSTPLPLSLANGGVESLAVDPVDPRIMVATTISISDAYVAVLDPSGSRVRYASYFGGTDSETVGTMALGAGGALAITGSTYSLDLPLMNPRIPQRSVLRTDTFVAVMRIPLPTVVIDVPGAGPIAPPFNVSGWAIDTAAPSGPGIDAVHVWALPQAGGAPTFVGVANYGAARPDVGSLYGAQFTNSGYSLTGGSLPAGPYTLAAFARSTVSGTFDVTTRSVDVLGGGRMGVDAPTAGAALYQPFTIAGWAFDGAAPSGTGIDTVHVWALPANGGPHFVGAATYGLQRPDVGAVFGDRFTATGFFLQASGLAPGECTLAIFARSVVTGTFDLVRTVRVTIPDGGAATIDRPVAGSVVSAPFVITGWAIDRQGAGTGVDAVHIWAYPTAGGAAVFLGAPSSVSRPDVAAAYGDPRFEYGGYNLTVNALPRGTYTVVVYARSVVTGAFSIVRTVQVTVN